MTTADHRPQRSVLIPWVIALVTLVGWSALLPDHVRIRKSDSSGEMELSQLADDAKTTGRVSSPQVFLASHPEDEPSLVPGSACLVLIERCVGQLALPTPEGAVRGRAPPARWSA